MDSRYTFRGKRLDNKEWMYGTLLFSNDWYCIVPNQCPPWGEPLIKVDPTTIGQCTGLSAEISYRGKQPDDLLIFEGDTLGCDGEIYGYVHYDAEYARYYLLDEYGDEAYKCASNQENWAIYEIFGNIYDNPELMEAQP